MHGRNLLEYANLQAHSANPLVVALTLTTEMFTCFQNVLKLHLGLLPESAPSISSAVPIIAPIHSRYQIQSFCPLQESPPNRPSTLAMHITTFVSILAAATIAVAAPQGSSLNDLPACAQQAGLASIDATGCDLTDIKCICSSVPFISTLRSYIEAHCTASDQAGMSDHEPNLPRARY